MQNLDQITGTVERFLFQDNESGFTIFVIQNSFNKLALFLLIFYLIYVFYS